MMTDMERSLPVGENDLPAAFQVADQGAKRTRNSYLWASRINLILILVGAISTSWAIESAQGRTALAILGALSLGIGLLVSLYIKLSDAEKTWFAYRAVAESIKTMTWRYSTKAIPYGPELSLKEADSLFTEQLALVLRVPRSRHAILVGDRGMSEQITARMRQFRETSLLARRELYIRDRIREQQNWYATKAKENAQKGSLLLFAVMVFQGLAIGAAVLLVRWSDFNLNFASIFSTVAAVIIAWQELKNHQELAYAYGQAAQELGLIIAREQHIGTDQDLSQFVSDAENAISREHTMWLARRDNV